MGGQAPLISGRYLSSFSSSLPPRLTSKDSREPKGTPLPFLLPSLYSSHLLFTSPPSALPPPPHSSTTKDKENLPSSRPPTYANDWAFEPSFHAVSAFVWEGLGSDELAEVRGGLALECVEAERGGWGEKMAVLSRRSRKVR